MLHLITSRTFPNKAERKSFLVDAQYYLLYTNNHNHDNDQCNKSNSIETMAAMSRVL